MSDERKERVAEASRLYYGESLTQMEVADRMGVHQSTVSDYLKDAREMWQERATQEVSEHVARMMAEHTERLAYATKKRNEVTDDDERLAWLKEERQWLKAMRDLLGVDGAKKVDVTSDGKALQATADERRERALELARILNATDDSDA
jgi:predicted transcriptional regulator